jgi:hypothetical protein
VINARRPQGKEKGQAMADGDLPKEKPLDRDVNRSATASSSRPR